MDPDTRNGEEIHSGGLPKIDMSHPRQITPSPLPAGGGEGGVTVKNKGDQEFSNLVSMICLNVQSEVLGTLDIPLPTVGERGGIWTPYT